MLGLFVRTFFVGISVAAPVGAMAVLCVDRVLKRGWGAGMATGLGIATADALYGAVAAFGVTVISSLLVEWQSPLRFVGGTALVVMGVRSALKKPVEQSDPEPPDSAAGYGSLYAGSVALTLTNPMTIMAFAAVFVSAGISTAQGALDALVATVGVGLGSLSWWIALVTVTAFMRHGVGGKAQLWLGRISGALVAGLGVFAIIGSFFLT